MFNGLVMCVEWNKMIDFDLAVLFEILILIMITDIIILIASRNRL